MILHCKFRGVIWFRSFNNLHLPFTFALYNNLHWFRGFFLPTICFLNIQWLRKTNRKPLLAAVEKMKEGTWSVFEQKSEACNSFLNLDFFSAELMLLGFISLLLTATSSIIANICISSKFYNSAFAPCTRSAVDEDNENNASHERKLLTAFGFPHLSRRVLNTLNENTCKQAHDSSYVFLSSRFSNLF